MKTVTFKLSGQQTKDIKGTFIHVEGRGGKIIFGEAVAGATEHETKESGKIKDISAFVAAFVRRIDTECRFDTVKLARKPEVSIIREEPPQTTNAIRVGEPVDQTFLDYDALLDETITVNSLNGTPVTLSLREIRNLKERSTFSHTRQKDYGKSKYINAVLKSFTYEDNGLSHIKNALSKTLGKVREHFERSDSPLYLTFNSSCSFQGIQYDEDSARSVDKTFKVMKVTKDMLSL